MKELLKRLTAEFQDEDYAHAYMESHAVSRIAAQIYALRKQRGWTQRELSEKSGVAQERISKIESADFSSLTMSTLQKFSRAFDVDMSVSFRAFSQGIMDVVNLSAETLKVEDRTADLATFCKMSVGEKRDGSLMSYYVPPGVPSIVFTASPQEPVGRLAPSDIWQSFSSIEVPQRRAATCS